MVTKKIKILIGVALLLAVFGCCRTFGKEELTVYTYSSFPVKLIDNIREYFRKNYRLEVDFKSFSDTGPLFNQLLRERKKPVAEVVIGLDNNYYAEAIKAGLFQGYRPRNLAAVKPELIFDPQNRLVPFDYGFVVFNYDSAKITDLPKTHLDLLKPQYYKKIIISNPLTSSPGQIFLLSTVALYGEKGYLDYWKKLKKNLLTIAPGWEEAYGMYTEGEAPLVLSYGASPVYHLLYEKTERYRALVLDGAAYAQIETAGILKNARNKKNAQILMDYLLTPQFQSLIPENQFMYPANSQVKLPESFRIAAKADRLLNLPPDKVAAGLDRWLNAWEKAINE